MNRSPTGQGVGLNVQPDIRYLYNRTGDVCVEGQVVVLDLAQSEAETTNSTPGDRNSSLSNVITAPSGDTTLEGSYLSALAMEDVADDARGPFLVRGMHNRASVVSGAVKNGRLSVKNATTELTNGGVGDKVVAICLEDESGGFAKVLFNGIEGLGNKGT